MRPHSKQPHSTQPHSKRSHSKQPHSTQPHSTQPHSKQLRSIQQLSSIHIHTIQRLGRYRQAQFSRSLPPLPCNRSLPPRHTFLTGLICPPLSKFDKIVRGL
jgi:hypothetical protein